LEKEGVLVYVEQEERRNMMPSSFDVRDPKLTSAEQFHIRVAAGEDTIRAFYEAHNIPEPLLCSARKQIQYALTCWRAISLRGPRKVAIVTDGDGMFERRLIARLSKQLARERISYIVIGRSVWREAVSENYISVRTVLVQFGGYARLRELDPVAAVRNAFAHLFERLGVQQVVVAHGRLMLEAVALETGRNLGLTNIWVPHGFPQISFKGMSVDYVLQPISRLAGYYKRLLGESVRIEPWEWLEPADSSPDHRPGAAGMILILTQLGLHRSHRISDDSGMELHRRIIGILRKKWGDRIVVRIKPRERQHPFVNQCRKEGVCVNSSGDLADLMPRAQLLVSFASTGLYHCYYSRIPGIEVRTRQLDREWGESVLPREFVQNLDNDGAQIGEGGIVCGNYNAATPQDTERTFLKVFA
jgi:hypothetical protein